MLDGSDSVRRSSQEPGAPLTNWQYVACTLNLGPNVCLYTKASKLNGMQSASHFSNSESLRQTSNKVEVLLISVLQVCDKFCCRLRRVSLHLIKLFKGGSVTLVLINLDVELKSVKRLTKASDRLTGGRGSVRGDSSARHPTGRVHEPGAAAPPHLVAPGTGRRGRRDGRLPPHPRGGLLRLASSIARL